MFVGRTAKPTGGGAENLRKVEDKCQVLLGGVGSENVALSRTLQRF